MNKFSKILLSGVVVGGLLTGCSSNEEASTEKTEETKPAKQEDLIKKPKKDENGNFILEEVGQKAKSEQATAELLKIKKVNETVDIAPLKVTVKDIKVIKLTDINSDMAEMIGFNTDTQVDPKKGFTYVQISYDAENTEEKNIDWYDLMNVVTDKGEQIDGQLKDFIIDDSDSDSQFLGKVKKEFTDGFILKDGDINKVKLVFGYTQDIDNEYAEITPQQTVEYTFQ
jgi:hypothetical protein